jgi:hypothetical protein
VSKNFQQLRPDGLLKGVEIIYLFPGHSTSDCFENVLGRGDADVSSYQGFLEFIE